jgi:uncharacterized membrane protein YciS (DUF1049 family)
MKKKILWINFIYIVVILVVIIIYLITIKFGAKDDVVKYLGFGLTITSLFVGLIAIFQALFSGNSLDRTIRVLDKSTQNMEKTSMDVKSIIQSLHAKVEEIPKQIGDLSDKVSQRLINTEIGKIDKPITRPSISKDIVMDFLNNSSTNGLIAMYVAAKANDLHKEVNVNNLFKDSVVNPSYIFGYIVAARSFNVFKASHNNDNISITESAVTGNEVYPILKQKINQLSTEQYRSLFNEILLKIDEHFVS